MRIPTRIGPAGILALLALGALLLAACGGGGEEKTGATATAEPNETATGKIDPCALITKAEAEKVLGEAVSEPKEETIGEVVKSCTYYAAAVSTKYVSIVARTGISKEDFEAEANATAGLMGGATPTAVSGVGDQAISVPPILWVLKGDVRLTVLTNLDIDFTVPENAAKVLETEKELAKKALGRLP